LELVDREFNNIAQEIDQISMNVNKDTKKGKLNYDINSTTLKEYLLTKLNDVIPDIVIPEF
jgi:putative GTP pyrophosphokinase